MADQIKHGPGGSKYGPGGSSAWAKVKRCVDEVTAKGNVDEPYGVCRAAVQGLEADSEAAISQLEAGGFHDARSFVKSLRSEPDAPTQTEVLRIFEPAVGAFQAEGIEAEGKMFRKELIREGEYVHPQDPEKLLAITPQRMQEWIRNFESGALDIVPTPYSHPTNNVEMVQNNHGKIVSLEIAPSATDPSVSALWGKVALDDEASKKVEDGTLASVSVGVAERKDNKGRPIGEVLEHVALTNDPYITGLAPFEAIAAEAAKSRGHAVMLFERRMNMEKKTAKAEGEGEGEAGKGIRAFKKMKFGDLVQIHPHLAKEAAAEADGEMRSRFAKAIPGIDHAKMDHAALYEAMKQGKHLEAEGNDEVEAEPKVTDKTDTKEGGGVPRPDPAGLGPLKTPHPTNTEAEGEAARMEATNRISKLEAEHAKALKEKEELASTVSVLMAERDKGMQAEAKRRIEAWTQAKFGIPAAHARKLSGLLFEATKSNTTFSFQAESGKPVSYGLAQFVCELLDGITNTGLVDNRQLAAKGGEPGRGPNSGPDGDAPDLNAQVKAYCEAKGYKPFSFEKPSKEEAARYGKVLAEMEKDGKLVRTSPLLGPGGLAR